MPSKETLEFYNAYVINVRDFIASEIEIRRTINRALKTGKQHSVTIHTKIYGLLFSTFSEANFMKMNLTPQGFEQKYVEEILRQSSIQEKWLKCLELAFIKFTIYRKGSEIPNKILELKRIIQKFIVDPSIIRNKIAHGQLTIALNSKNTSLNPIITNQLGELNMIQIYRWFEINKKLCSIIEDLIESPEKAHYQFYYKKYQELENYISKTESWTIQSKLLTKSMKKKIVNPRS